MKGTDLIFSSAEGKAKTEGLRKMHPLCKELSCKREHGRAAMGWGVPSLELDMSSADPPWGRIPPCFGASSASGGRFKDMNCHRAEGQSRGLHSGCPPAPGRQRAF